MRSVSKNPNSKAAWYWPLSIQQLSEWSLLIFGVVPFTVFRTVKRNGDKMQDLEEMAAKLLETVRKLPPGAERHAMLSRSGYFAPS
jgi:hypothetical protein